MLIPHHLEDCSTVLNEKKINEYTLTYTSIMSPCIYDVPNMIDLRLLSKRFAYDTI